MPSRQKDIYQLKITLHGSKPPIWRRVQVPADIRLHKLHKVIQTVMGWSNSHLHQFIDGESYYGEPHPDYGSDFFGSDMDDEKKVRLSDLVWGEGGGFDYEYDFGDSWLHRILVEKILPPEPGVRYPRLIKGKRACPPEDVGGLWGYEEFLEAIGDPNHPEHQDMLAWIGGEFDPEEFDMDVINKDLGKIRL
jgi:hypothetical protein